MLGLAALEFLPPPPLMSAPEAQGLQRQERFLSFPGEEETKGAV